MLSPSPVSVRRWCAAQTRARSRSNAHKLRLRRPKAMRLPHSLDLGNSWPTQTENTTNPPTTHRNLLRERKEATTAHAVVWHPLQPADTPFAARERTCSSVCLNTTRYAILECGPCLVGTSTTQSYRVERDAHYHQQRQAGSTAFSKIGPRLEQHV